VLPALRLFSELDGVHTWRGMECASQLLLCWVTYESCVCFGCVVHAKHHHASVPHFFEARHSAKENPCLDFSNMIWE